VVPLGGISTDSSTVLIDWRLYCDAGETPWPDNVQLFQPYEGTFILLVSFHIICCILSRLHM